MLAERAKVLLRRVRQYDVRRQEVVNAQKFRTRAQQLGEPAERLTQLAQTVRVFRKRNISVTIPEEKVFGLRSQAEEFLEGYRSDRESILRGDGQLRFAFWETLKRFPQEVERALQDAWTHYVSERVPTGQQDLLLILERVPGFADKVRVIRQGMEQAKRLQNSLPQSESVFGQVDDLAQQLKRAWEELHSDEISEEIVAFLRAVSAGRGTLADVTPEVWDWLQRYGLLGSFRVTL